MDLNMVLGDFRSQHIHAYASSSVMRPSVLAPQLSLTQVGLFHGFVLVLKSLQGYGTLLVDGGLCAQFFAWTYSPRYAGRQQPAA